MPAIDELSNGAVVSDAGIVTTPSGGSYVYGKGYAFILLGNPTASPVGQGGTFNTKFLHFLAFPTSNP